MIYSFVLAIKLILDSNFVFGSLAVDTLCSGGSTIVLLFEKGVFEWDEDLLINGRSSLETLVRAGMGIGRSRRVFFNTTTS